MLKIEEVQRVEPVLLEDGKEPVIGHKGTFDNGTTRFVNAAYLDE